MSWESRQQSTADSEWNLDQIKIAKDWISFECLHIPE